MPHSDPLAGLDAGLVRDTLLEAAELAATITLPRFRSAMTVDNKWTEGFDPVTDADREAEVAIRALLSRRFPDHGITGEEYEAHVSDSPFTWVIDPIDGTRAFICGVPVWATLLGLTVGGRAVAGLMAQPFTGETFLGLPGAAIYRRLGEMRVLRTSAVTELGAAKMTTTSPDLMEPPSVAPAWQRIRQAVLHTRYGLDSYGFCMLAMGQIDLVVEAGLKDVDIAPLIPIVENAGGVATTWDGAPAEAGGNCVLAATPELHAAAVALLRG